MARTALPALSQKLRDLPRRARATARLAQTTGMLWEMHAAWLRAAMLTLGRDHPHPSAIYAIHAKNRPTNVAIRHHDRVLTFAQLEERLNRLGQGLLARGLLRK